MCLVFGEIQGITLMKQQIYLIYENNCIDKGGKTNNLTQNERSSHALFTRVKLYLNIKLKGSDRAALLNK